MEQAGDAKAAIAAHAAALVGQGTTVFLDASSSALALARRLQEDPPNELTLVTNSPAIAFEMRAEPVHIVVAPGELDQHMRMIAGRWTVEFLSQLNFALAFVSAAGVTLDQGLTTSRRPLADVVNAARASAERTVGLIDATKFGRASLLSIARVAELDAVVTDAELPPAIARAIPCRGRPSRNRAIRGGKMSRPVTLFTGQWADLPLEELAAKCGAWGFDGLELACWGDHFDVAEALRDPGYCAGRRELLERHGLGCWAIGNHLVGQAVCDPIDERHRGVLPPEVWGDGDPEGVPAARRGDDEGHGAGGRAARRRGRDGLHRARRSGTCSTRSRPTTSR